MVPYGWMMIYWDHLQQKWAWFDNLSESLKWAPQSAWYVHKGSVRIAFTSMSMAHHSHESFCVTLPEQPSFPVSHRNCASNVLQVGGPFWEVPLGRNDSKTAGYALVGANLPGSDDGLLSIISKFLFQGLSVTDTVALSGEQPTSHYLI